VEGAERLTLVNRPDARLRKRSDHAAMWPTGRVAHRSPLTSGSPFRPT
jgi:hypothetical protein